MQDGQLVQERQRVALGLLQERQRVALGLVQERQHVALEPVLLQLGPLHEEQQWHHHNRLQPSLASMRCHASTIRCCRSSRSDRPSHSSSCQPTARWRLLQVPR